MTPRKIVAAFNVGVWAFAVCDDGTVFEADFSCGRDLRTGALSVGWIQTTPIPGTASDPETEVIDG